MRLIKVAASSVNQIPLDWDNNAQRIIKIINEAIEQDVDVLCLPELSISGYGCEDAFLMPETAHKAWNTFCFILESFPLLEKQILVSFGLPIVHNNSLYNCSVLVSFGAKATQDYEILAIVPKQNLCSDGIHYESRWFKPWPAGQITKHRPTHLNVPFGDVVVSYNDVKIGFEICEDAWSTNRPGASLANRGVDIVLNPSASHFSFGKHNIRKSFINEGSRAYRCTYVYSNLLGNESGRVIFDGDTYISSGGKMVAKGRRLSFKNHTLTTATVDLNVNRAAQMRNFSHHSTDDGVINFSGRFFNVHSAPAESHHFSYFDEEDKFDTFEQVVALGLRDYLLKSHSKGFVVSLSGGADSATVSVLVQQMVRRGEQELGQMFGKQLDFYGIPYKPHSASGGLLTCVYQASSNSSNETFEAARQLAKGIDADFHKIDISDIIDKYVEAAESILGRQMTWEQDDIALQNIQARVRCPSIWMIANVKNALLLTTSNRSEAAVGYFSTDGDSCGGLAPIAGVSKEFILEWMKYHYNKWKDFYHTPEESPLGLVIKQTPTAELRPGSENQTDEDDLMPYPILNKIEVLFVRDKLGPSDIIQILESDGIHDPARYVDKFFKLFCANQWKREKISVSFHLDDESLDPKTFCRWPVLSKRIV